MHIPLLTVSSYELFERPSYMSIIAVCCKIIPSYSSPKLLRLINICINTWQIFAVAFLWTTVHYVWWLWLRSSLVGWVGLFCRLVSWVGLGWVGSISYWVGLGWITENGPTSMSGRARWCRKSLTFGSLKHSLSYQTVNRLSTACYRDLRIMTIMKLYSELELVRKYWNFITYAYFLDGLPVTRA